MVLIVLIHRIAVLKNHKYNFLRINIANEIFVAKSKYVINLGHTEIMVWQKVEEDSQNYNIVKGTSVSLK